MSAKPKFQGVIVPLVTPFTASGGLDEAAAAKLADRLAGLAVSFGILKRHNATISVDSPPKDGPVPSDVAGKPGKGATFIVRFPVQNK